ncbi:hypothetical protein LshimejAT787_1204430 [Lyophyllum shimeji]|uniref:Uncharacterized protein n=1 Tax=Lyophyllum shimeji TaxID=47721 RepID=A0A9P3PWQ9_LYOSH|nr:hypothetical protein LshimejAT787_1204430 [Lyophyllum shimeji]
MTESSFDAGWRRSRPGIVVQSPKQSRNKAIASAPSATPQQSPRPAPLYSTYKHSCLDAEKAVRASERAVPSVTARFFATTSRVSPSPPFAASPVVVVSSVSLASSTRKPAVSSRSSLRTSSVTLSPTLSTPSAKPSPLSTSSMPSNARVALCTVSVPKHLDKLHLVRRVAMPLIFMTHNFVHYM